MLKRLLFAFILSNMRVYGKLLHDMPKRTYQPKKRKRARVHGFRSRNASNGGQNVLKSRRLKGRKKLTPVASGAK